MVEKKNIKCMENTEIEGTSQLMDVKGVQGGSRECPFIEEGWCSFSPRALSSFSATVEPSLLIRAGGGS
jgi:hypothetical protein